MNVCHCGIGRMHEEGGPGCRKYPNWQMKNGVLLVGVKENIPAALAAQHDGDWSQHPLLLKSRELCGLIEQLPACEDQTRLIGFAHAVAHALQGFLMDGKYVWPQRAERELAEAREQIADKGPTLGQIEHLLIGVRKWVSSNGRNASEIHAGLAGVDRSFEAIRELYRRIDAARGERA